MAKKITLKDNNKEILYPQTTNTQLITEDGNTFSPQEELVAGTGISIASDKKTISTNLTLNGNAPVDNNWQIPTDATPAVDAVANNNMSPVTSNAVYRVINNGINAGGGRYITTSSSLTPATMETLYQRVFALDNTQITRMQIDWNAGSNQNYRLPVFRTQYDHIVDDQLVTEYKYLALLPTGTFQILSTGINATFTIYFINAGENISTL